MYCLNEFVVLSHYVWNLIAQLILFHLHVKELYNQSASAYKQGYRVQKDILRLFCQPSVQALKLLNRNTDYISHF